MWFSKSLNAVSLLKKPKNTASCLGKKKVVCKRLHHKNPSFFATFSIWSTICINIYVIVKDHLGNNVIGRELS